MNDERPLVDVVCAIVQKPNGDFLLAQRPVGKVYAGYWEFPGGKVDRGESLADATARELNEELGIDVQTSYPWLTRNFSYPHANVRLHFRRVVKWRNEPRSRENQAFAWQSISSIKVAPLLPANGPILAALTLPTIYGITHAENIGETAMLENVRRALANGLSLIQVREKNWPRERLISFAKRVTDVAHPFRAKVMLNGDWELAREAGADGVHLTSTALMKLTERPAIDLCGASCHNDLELAKAAELNLDFVLLGPVLPTPSHPDSEVLGWQKFNDLVTNYSLPIYAIGGLSVGNQESAWHHGAHGIAMLRHAWLA
jgi:8-oxo-dGTP diphosphatase